MITCEKCGAVLPEGCDSCLICGVDDVTPPFPDEPELLEEKPDGQKAAVSRYSKRLTTVCVSICVLLALSAALLWGLQYLSYLSSSTASQARGAIIYLTEDGRLKYKTSSMELPEDIVGDYKADTKISGQNLAKASPNGRYIAYLNRYFTVGGVASGELFVRDFGQKTAPDSSEIADMTIAENVTSEFFFAGNSGSLVFQTADGGLYVTDFTDSRLLDDGVSEVIDHTDTQILYAKESDNGLNVYLIPDIAGSGLKIHVDDGIITLSDYTSAFDRFIYLRENPGGSRDAVSYDVKLDKRQPLAVGVDDIIAADARISAVLYQTSAENPVHYDNIIDDSLAKSDEKIKEPDLADYPLLEEFIDKYGIDADYEGSLEYEEIVEEKSRFQSASEEYNDKNKREKLRDEIRDTIDIFAAEHPLLYDLHLIRDGVTTKLAGGSYLPFNDAELDAGNGFTVWRVTSLNNFQKTPLAQYQAAFASSTLLDYLNDCVSDRLYLQQFGYSAAPLYLGDGQFYSAGWQLTEKGDGIYFAMGDGGSLGHSDNACKLYYAPVLSGVTGNIVQVDENVAGIGPMLSGNRLLYYKDRFEYSCDLYLMSGVSAERIGDDVSLQDEYFKVENNGKTLLYCEHFNSSSEDGNMFMLSAQSRQLATEVHRVFYRDDMLVYFLRSYKNNKAELYSFGSDGLVRIDENVISVME